jgi:hypothetical protein
VKRLPATIGNRGFSKTHGDETMRWRIVATLLLGLVEPFVAAMLGRLDGYHAKELFLWTFAPVIAVSEGVVGALLCRKSFWVAAVGTFLGVMLTSLTLLRDPQWEPGTHLFGSLLASGVLGVITLVSAALTFGAMSLLGSLAGRRSAS